MYPRDVGDEMNEWICRSLGRGLPLTLPNIRQVNGQFNFVINSTTSIVVYGIKFKPNYITIIIRILYM